MSKFENIINQALNDSKNNFFNKYKVSAKNIQLIRKAKKKNKTIKKTKRKKINSNNNYKSLLGS